MNRFRKMVINQLHYFHWGTFFITKYTVVLQLIIILKLWNVPPQWYAVCCVVGVLGIQVFGWVLDRMGVIDAFTERTNKGLIKGMKR